MSVRADPKDNKASKACVEEANNSLLAVAEIVKTKMVRRMHRRGLLDVILKDYSLVG